MNPIVFQHLPKTGGPTLHELLLKYFALSEVFPERFNNLARFSQDNISNYIFFSGHFDRDSISLIPGSPMIISLFRKPQDRILSLFYFWRSHKMDFILQNNLSGPLIAKSNSLIDFLRITTDGIPSNIENAYARNIIGFSQFSKMRLDKASDGDIAELALHYIDNFSSFGLLEYMVLSVSRIFSSLSLPQQVLIGKRRSLSDKDPNRETVVKEALSEDVLYELDRLSSIDSIIYRGAYSRFQAFED